MVKTNSCLEGWYLGPNYVITSKTKAAIEENSKLSGNRPLTFLLLLVDRKKKINTAAIIEKQILRSKSTNLIQAQLRPLPHAPTYTSTAKTFSASKPGNQQGYRSPVNRRRSRGSTAEF